jgi:tetratricopeptide (TPR) repeat protein
VALLGAACTTPATTQRIVAGRTLEGRYVAPEAYAAVLHAELLAAQGMTQRAHEAYQDAAELAGYSPEIWTRLGALACQLKRPDFEDAFAKAEARDAHYEPLWRARAECALTQGDPSRALQAAERAIALDPTQAHDSELVVQALSRLQQTHEATRWQHAFELLALRNPSLSKPMNAEGGNVQAALDRALRAHDLPLARRLALRLRIDPSALALRALTLGLPQPALEQAQLVLGANPSDADARVAALCAADLLRDTSRFHALLITPLKSESLRPAAVVELDRLLSRRTSTGEEPADSTAPTKDP